MPDAEHAKASVCETGIYCYITFDEEKLVGMLGDREENCHICFLVDGEYQPSVSGEISSNESINTDAIQFLRECTYFIDHIADNTDGMTQR